MKSSKFDSAFFMFFTAKEFFENGTTYAGKYFKMVNNQIVKPFDNYVHAKLCAPATNISFSLELAFKAILKHYGLLPKKPEHNLLKLFYYIPDDIRQKIIAHYQTHDTYKAYVTIHLTNISPAEHGRMKQEPLPEKTESFVVSMLNENSLAFIRFRYLHEYDGAPWIFRFREFSNIVFSALTILGELLNINVTSNVK